MDTTIITIDVSKLYESTGTAKLSDLPFYEETVLKLVGEGTVVKLTGPGPIWLYLRLAHRLHGKGGRLIYSSPVTGEVVIFDHDPY